jgi:adenylosuccinate lyase
LPLFKKKQSFSEIAFKGLYLCLSDNKTMTTLNRLNAISPIDGRYRNKTLSLAPFFSEEALIKYRVLVEIEYFIALCEVPLPQLSGVNPDF